LAQASYRCIWRRSTISSPSKFLKDLLMSQTAPQLTQLGRYTELKLLGQGGMGAVYRALDPSLQRTVAIKVMLGQNPEFLARFEREARAVAKLSHPNVVQVYDFGRDDDGNPYFVMELLPGRSLDSLLKESGPLPPLKVADVLRQAAEGLTAAHAVGIVHRDIKPHNLMLDDSGRVKLVDFGIARDLASTEELTSTQATPGTMHYMAPEVLSGQPADARADIYALGLVGFHLLAGKPPFTGQSAVAVAMKQINEPLPDLGKEVPLAPPELRRLIERMTEKDREARIQTCGEIAKEALTILTNLKMATTRPAPMALGSGRQVILMAGGLGLLCSVALAVVLAKTGKGGGRHRPIATVAQVGQGATGGPVGAQPTRGKEQPGVLPTAVTGAAAGAEPAVKSTQTGPVRVSVLKWKNLSADTSLTAMVEGLAEETTVELSALSGQIRLLERNQLDEQNLPELMRSKTDYIDKATAAAIGKVLGAELVIQGAFQRVGDELKITARFVRLDTGEILHTLAMTGEVKTGKQQLAMQEKIAAQIKTQLLAVLPKVRS
jgi:TolB-like protein